MKKGVIIGQPFVKWFMLCYRTIVHLSCLSVTLEYWPIGWMDQDATWYGGRPRPWLHCARWRPSPPPKRDTTPQFSAHVCCGGMAGWIKMPLGTKVGFGEGHIVLDGDIAPSPKGSQPPIFSPCLFLSNGRPSQLLLSSCCYLFEWKSKLNTATCSQEVSSQRERGR